MTAALPTRAAALVRELALQPHPEGGYYRELFRSTLQVAPADDRAPRCALTCIDFLLARGQFSAWHRVRSDEVWHRLEGAALSLWLMAPTFDRIEQIVLDDTGAGRAPRHAVPAGCWQAAESLGEFTLCGATVGPGFEFEDFAFLRDDTAARAALARLAAPLQRLL